MIFDEIPFELKEHIFTYVTPNEWINTAKVSKEWLKLTLGCIKKVESCHVLILDHLAEFINKYHNTNYTWISLLTLMPKLEHLECIESTEAFWTEISPICHQLKVLTFKPRNVESFDWNKLDISFVNLTELLWDGSFSGVLLADGTYEGPDFPPNLFASSPKLEIIKVANVPINAEWKNKIPKSVKHILLDRPIFNDDHLRSVEDLCKDTSALETFSAAHCVLPRKVSSEFFAESPRLKKLELQFKFSGRITSRITRNTFRNCRGLETVKVRDVKITDRWQKVIPENVKSIKFFKMNVQENIRRDFSFDWLFQNYSSLQSLQVTFEDWTGYDSQKFYSTENLKTLVLDNFMRLRVRPRNKPIDPISEICFRMICGSNLVDVEICTMTFDESWEHIFPPTIKILKLKKFYLTKEAQMLFSPQFICGNPSNIEILMLETCIHDLPAMDLNAFTGMHMLQELHLDLRLSGECLQSILTHCSALTNLFIQVLTDGALTNYPHNLVLPTLRKLDVQKPVNNPSWLLKLFPKVRTLNIVIGPCEEYFSDIMQAMQEVETVEIKIQYPDWFIMRSLIESIDDTKFKYFCLTCKSKVVDFYFTNSFLDACRKLNDVLIFRKHHNVLRITDNYPTSPLLRRNVSRIPVSMDELSQRYHELVAPEKKDSSHSDEFDCEFDDEWLFD